MMTMRNAARWGSVILLALPVFLFGTGCSKAPAPAPAAPAAPVVQQGPDAPLEILTVETDDKTSILFLEYVRQLKAGDLIQASANLSSLKSQLRGEDLNDPFWNDRLPPEHRIMLLIGALCTTCTDGDCPECKGRKICQSCQGNGQCKDCHGEGGAWHACQQCVCKACAGNRACPECKGRRSVACPACGGSGNGKDEYRFDPCPSCGGKGYKDGLKGANGSAAKVKCLRCNGTRGVTVTVRTSCPACEGSGRKTCTLCRGTGACPTCRGMGRASDCTICGGQGRFLDPCKTCLGRKVCVECGGSKACKSCGGQGSCKDCVGKNLIVRHRMPVDRRWLLHPIARVMRPDRDSLVEESPTNHVAVFILEGRNVTAEAPEGSLLWASSPQDLRRISELFVK